MIAASEIYEHMARVSQRYDRLKGLFEEFGALANARLNGKNCPVQGVQFRPEYENDRFYVRFAGNYVCFAFSADLGPNSSAHGFVKCNLVDPVTKAVGEDVGSFSFNRQGEIEPKFPPDGDPVTLNSRDGAAYLVLEKLNAALG